MTDASLIDFRRHITDTGSEEAARVDFHRMLSALIGVEHPTATDIRPDPGDWGIDVIAGSLVESVLIWQSKYFINEFGDAQKRQVRESLKSAMGNANREGYRVDAWTLCVPIELSAPEKKWWDGRVKEWQKLYPGVAFDLWDAPRLRRKLMTRDADHVREEFFGPRTRSTPVGTAGSLVAPLISAEPTPAYPTALFVRQLAVAGISEIDGQRRAFFNADLLARDVESRAVVEEVAAISELDSMLLSGWEDAYADPLTAPNGSQYEISARGLYVNVMARSERVAAPPELPIRAIHARGFMHRIVEDGRAGWVHDWRAVAADHRSALVNSDSEEGSA